MTKSFTIAVAVVLSLGLSASAQSPSGNPQSNPKLNALVKVADHIKLPAKEPGVLVHLTVKEGSEVRAGDQIGKIDDRENHIQMEAAQYGYDAAYKKFKDEVDIQYSDAGAAVAKADYEIMQAAINLVEKSITEVDLRRAKLEWDKMDLASVKARKERELARLDALAKHAEVKAAKLAIERRLITAPFDGVVEEMNRKQDEWVNPGDTILRLLRMDTMNVESSVNYKEYDPPQLQGCKVTVEVEMASGRKTVEGRITRVSSAVRYDGVYEVRAEVPNRKENGAWLLRDNLPAEMTIHLGTGGPATESASRTK